MLEIAINILNKLEENGYQAYIVGGFVRDYILNIESHDIDIITNAKPKELLELFDNAKVPKEDYGSVILNYKKYSFEISTFRRELKYVDNRKPVEIEYIDSLDLDILRRDFTINTLCMDKNKNIIDILNGGVDIENKIIKTVGDGNKKFSEDALRILRAVRFATKLNFSLDNDVKEAIKKNKHLLKNISYERKKEELDKIFTSPNNKLGIKLLLDLGLEKDLEIDKLKNVVYTDNLIAIWTVLDVVNLYHFTNNEKNTQNMIKMCLNEDILNKLTLYKYGLYITLLAANIKGISIEKLNDIYKTLPIYSRNDIKIRANDIINILNIKPGKLINEIFDNIEINILNGNLKNDKDTLIKYVIDYYK